MIILLLYHVRPYYNGLPWVIGIAFHTTDPPAPHKKTKKSKKAELEEYFSTEGSDGKNRIDYDTKPDGSGYKSTVYCPVVGYAIGDMRFSEERAEENAAKKALIKLLKES